jgi:amino acid adenylation domain-containing protein
MNARTATDSFPLSAPDVERSIQQRFEAVARRYPDRVAIKTRDAVATYAQLDQVADRIAQALLAASGPEPEPVVLLVADALPGCAAIFGALKAGKAYVPFDPAWPRDRLLALTDAVAPKVIVSDRANAATAQALAGGRRRVLDVDGLPTGAAGGPMSASPGPDALAEIVFTSGSTGTPKGVMQSHRSLLHHCMRVSHALRIGPEDRVTLFASFGTGQARTVMYRALLNGAALHQRNLKREGLAGLADWLRAESISIFSSSATVFRAFVDGLPAGEAIPSLRLIRVGSEPVAAKDVERYRALFPPSCLFVNALSSTETGVIVLQLIDHDTPLDGSFVPVGYPVDGMEVQVRREDGGEAEVGETGEIVVRSRYLSPGYWHEPATNAAAFVAHRDDAGVRSYRTGDLGRFLPDGRLVHLGRTDSRVKIRGNRVDVVEVEHALREHPAVKDARVVAQPDRNGEQRIVGYVVPAERVAPSVRGLQEFLSQRLASFMVPTAFVVLDALPLTASGKVDRRRLPEPAPDRSSSMRPYVAPETSSEILLSALWSAILGVEPIGLHDTFLELGGDSLLAMRLINRVRVAFDIHGAAGFLLRAETVHEMALAIEESRGGAPVARRSRRPG